jgi:hypothetical protein
VIIPLASIHNYKKVIKINLTTSLNSKILHSPILRKKRVIREIIKYRTLCILGKKRVIRGNN